MKWTVTRAQRVGGIVEVVVQSHDMDPVPLLHVAVLDDFDFRYGYLGEIFNLSPGGVGRIRIEVDATSTPTKVVVVEILETGGRHQIEGRSMTARLI